MPKSFQKMCSEASDLCAIAGLKPEGTVCVSIRCHGIEIHVEPLELARLAKVFNVPRQRVNAETSVSGAIHVNFNAKGANWRCCILKARVTEFYEAFGGDPQLLLTAEQQSLPQQQSLLLECTDV